MIDPTNGVMLAPCPFCGCPASQRESGGWYGTGCDGSPKCPAHLFGLMHRTQAEANAAWNGRAAAGVSASAGQTSGAESVNALAAPSYLARQGEQDSASFSALVEPLLQDKGKGE